MLSWLKLSTLTAVLAVGVAGEYSFKTGYYDVPVSGNILKYKTKTLENAEYITWYFYQK